MASKVTNRVSKVIAREIHTSQDTTPKTANKAINHVNNKAIAHAIRSAHATTNKANSRDTNRVHVKAISHAVVINHVSAVSNDREAGDHAQTTTIRMQNTA